MRRHDDPPLISFQERPLALLPDSGLTAPASLSGGRQDRLTRSASIVGDNRVVFNIKGNNYRLVARINDPGRIVYVRFVGTHTEYDAVDVKEV